jgi:hypothetical protein
MNLNRALILSLLILSLFVVVTVFNFSRSKKTDYQYGYIDNEHFMMNSHCIPEIIRSYEKVKNIFSKKNILIFRYIQNSCNSCLDSQLKEILTLQEEVGKDHIWIFPAYPDDRNSRIKLSSELAKYNYRNIPADSLLIPTYEGEQRSYFAWINNEGDVDMVFVSDRSNIQSIRRLFVDIKRKIQMIEKN